MNKFKPWLLLSLVFVAGFTGGVVVTRMTVRQFVRQVANNPDVVRVRFEGELDRELRFDAEQRRQVHQIMMTSQERIHAVRQEFQPQIAGIRQETHHEIAAVLRPAQRERFEKLRAERRLIQGAPPRTEGDTNRLPSPRN
jgi:hypothetical protein